MTHGNRLRALLDTGLMDRLDARDKRVLERRADLAGADEEAAPVDPRGWWYAVPADAYEGVFEVLGLHDRFPCTLAEGADVEDMRHRRGAMPVFITPELDGWRLVFGNLDSVVGVDWDDWMGTVERLSARCGRAQMFFTDGAGGSDVWVVAERGRIRRRYAAESDPEWIGAPLPWEEPGTDGQDLDGDGPNVEGTAGAAEACGALSVDPAEIGTGTRVRGHGWLALSAPGVGHEELGVLV
ncbi:hypothetical protein AB0C70_17595 [Streptomyces sp. NPDC048564]|uniref:hypothetical protein n=1 Tax=Streptomyces sp. NPDC048564 TaxID=3155760 RepID=UPI00342B92B2